MICIWKEARWLSWVQIHSPSDPLRSSTKSTIVSHPPNIRNPIIDPHSIVHCFSPKLFWFLKSLHIGYSFTVKINLPHSINFISLKIFLDLFKSYNVITYKIYNTHNENISLDKKVILCDKFHILITKKIIKPKILKISILNNYIKRWYSILNQLVPTILRS